jgi:hypothetical protein
MRDFFDVEPISPHMGDTQKCHANFLGKGPLQTLIVALKRRAQSDIALDGPLSLRALGRYADSRK